MDFEQFMAEQLPALIRYATMLAGDRELAQDVVQEALIRASTRWDRISREIGERPAAMIGNGDASEIVRQLPSGRWAKVLYSRDPGAPPIEPDIRAVALRVASSIRDGAGRPVRVGFVLDYLPSGSRSPRSRRRRPNLGRNLPLPLCELVKVAEGCAGSAEVGVGGAPVGVGAPVSYSGTDR
jgi:hypothetical protein